MDCIEYVRAHLSKEELLAQLAEECNELGKAALKLRRAYSGENPTPVKRADAFANLVEEIADVTLCIEVLGCNTPEILYNCGKIWEEKSARWMNRIMERKSKTPTFDPDDLIGEYEEENG
jgi:NTP pyrophosphatase (non-canonical NTP hydrolase)